MDGFNSKEFYGHSLSEDPKLRTTTRNYEFKYNSSDHLERIISRVRKDREKKTDIKQLARNNDHVKLHNQLTKTEKSQIMKMPLVETQIGSFRSRETEAVVKIMSDEEIDAMLSQALQSTNNLPGPAEIKSFSHVLPSKEMQKSEEIAKDEKLPQLSVEILPNLQPQWVEIKPVQKSFASLFEVPLDSSHTDDSLDSEELSALNLGRETPEKGNEKHGINESKSRYFDTFSFGSMMTEDFVIRNEESNFQNGDNGDKESLSESQISLGIESSLNESEQLEMERVFKTVLPQVPKMQFESLESEEKSEYSEYSDEEDETEYTKSQADGSFGVEAFDTQPQPEVHIKKKGHASCPIQTLSFRSSAQPSPPKTSRSVKKTAKLHKAARPLSANKSSPKASPEVRLNIQIEDLKQEKLRIFSKMTSIQEKIIESLDALRLSLVETSLPDGEVEKKLRERNALEFAVRFSRNYLFPLGKMIDDLRFSPKDDYRSALTNEPCVKVCGIYGLLSEAIRCYQKQLRHFVTDSFPKKLDLLLSLIKDTITICLEKQIFDKRDTLIQCLLSRCEMFLEFLVEFAENKKKSAQNEEMALQSERRSRFKLPKTSSKWDLTMSLNNLNMYEPKLVQKKTKKASQKKTMKVDSQRRTSKSKNTKLIPRDSADHIAAPIDDPVETQVRKDSNLDSDVQLINDAIAEEPDSELAKSVIETLQDITKDEVHQMFGPIVSNLNSILNSSDNPQTAVESVPNVLKSKFQEVKCKQLKIDEIATENSTQNSNSHQKQVTKKGTHSSKGKQQKQQLKETRQNKLSKARAKVANCSSKNVKEDSTEQTERYSRSELADTNTICDKQSLRNIDVAAFFSENNSMKQKSCSGAFLSASAAAAAQAAKKPTPAPDTNNEVGGIAAAAQPLLTPLSILPVKLDDVMPPQPPPSQHIMTSEQCLDNSTALPVGLPLPQADKFVSKSHNIIIGDGKHRKEDAASQRNVRDGAANAIDRAEDNQEAWRKNLPAASSPVRNEATKSGEMDKLYYRRNALYTFVKYSQNEQDVSENVNENPNNVNVCCEIKTQKGDTTIKSTEENILESPSDTVAGISTGKQTNEEHRNDIDIKALLEERNDFIERCKDDPLYTNSQFPQPWKVLAKISNVIAREIVENFEDDLSFGEESYIRDFIDMEIQN